MLKRITGQIKNRNKVCAFIFGAYSVFLFFMYYCLCISSNAFTSVLSGTSDPDEFLYLFNLFGDIGFFDLNVKNVIYTVFMFFSDNPLISFTWTSFLLYMVSVLLVFKIANFYKDSNLYGLIAVFIYTTFPGVFVSSYGINIHISETMMLLFVLYFYLKSNYFSSDIYSWLYVLFMVFALGERESVLIYISIILCITSLAAIKKKKYFSLKYNFFAGVIALLIILSYSSRSYMCDKAGHLPAFFTNLDLGLLLRLPYLIILEIIKRFADNISVFYVLTIFSFLAFRLLNPPKYKDVSFKFIEFFIIIVFGLYFFAVVPSDPRIVKLMPLIIYTAFHEIYPVLPFLALWIANLFYLYKRFTGYVLLSVAILFAFFPVNLMDYSFSHLIKKETYMIENKLSHSDVFTDIADYLNVILYKSPYENFWFSLELVDKKDVLSEAGAFKDNFEQRYEIGTSFMASVEHIILISGFSYGHDTYEGILNKAKELDVDAGKIYMIFVCHKNKRVSFDRKKHSLEKIKTWAVSVNDMDFHLNIHAFAQK